MNAVVKEVLKKIEQAGFEAYLVGGYPRNLLLGIETFDFDICTSAKSEELERIFNIPINDNFGSVSLKYKNQIFEITTYRKEIKYDGVRTPSIVYTENLAEDIMRRDFTINTICIDSNDNIVDLLNGVEDIKRKVVRCVGDADKKLSEDPLRILRAIRFACVLNFDIDGELALTIKRQNHRVKDLSYFRKKQELDKIFNSPNIEKGINLLKEYNLIEYLDIEINQVVPTANLGIWSQIKYSNEYPFTKGEKIIISKIRTLISKEKVDNYDLYINGLSVALIAGQILRIPDDNIRKSYLLLPIKNRHEIDISSDDIAKYNKVKISDVYTILEKRILDNKLINNRKSIIEYLNELADNNVDK